MHTLHNLFYLLMPYVLLFLMGVGVSLAGLPMQYRRFAFYIAPAVGYIAFCFLAIWFSGITNAPMVKATLWALVCLLALSGITLFRYRKELSALVRDAKPLVLLFAVMVLCVFWPVLKMGLDLYIGTANPDFYQSLSFHESLVRFNAKFWVESADLHLAGRFQDSFPVAFQARFGGVAVSILFEQLFGLAPRTALMTSVVVFLLSLPPAVYFFCSTVLEFKRRESVLSGILVAISAATSMSFIHTFIGQNSALATFPLAIGLVYLALKARSVRIAGLAALVLNGIFWLYVMALPYILAPFGLFAVFRLFREGKRDTLKLLAAIGVFVAVCALVHFSVLADSIRFVKNLFELLGKLTQSQYYADFLTEEVFEYASGLTSYPLSQSMFFHGAHNSIIPALVGLLLAMIYFLSLRAWSKTASRDAQVLTFSLIGTYIIVWLNYTFHVRYGYASFKMSAWLQFIACPFYAWYIVKNWDAVRCLPFSVKQWRPYLMLLMLLPVYTLLNLGSDLDYGIKSFGRDRIKGSLINSYGIAGNRDFLELAGKLKTLVPRESTIALGFGDSIENDWALYYAGKSVNTLAMLSHEEIPFEDAYLPDIYTRKYKDSMGDTQTDAQKYLHGGVADYYLMPGSNNLNSEILDKRLNGTPLWGNDTFALYRKSDIHDLIVLGRGFYRIEHMDTAKINFWWPEVFRWSAEGGEIYQFLPSAPGREYRVAFSAITGLGQASGRRTIELFHNGEKFDEVLVDGVARIISKPYRPVDGVNRIVLRVKEKSVLVPRNAGLWNRDLPDRSTPINILFGNVRVMKATEHSSTDFPVGSAIDPKAYLGMVDAFNGVDADGWLRESATISIRRPADTMGMRLKILVPGNLGWSFPYKVQFKLNNTTIEKSYAVAGEYSVDLELPRNAVSELVRLDVKPQMAKRLAEGMIQREVVQSIRISSIELLTQ